MAKALGDRTAGGDLDLTLAVADGSNARVADFITGFQNGTEIDEVWGYPMGITTDAAGNLYVSSDL